MVKRRFILVMGMFILLIASHVQAIDLYDNFSLEGYGSFMDANPTWNGDLIGGSLSPGTFWLKVDGSGWICDNPGTPENERWDYIFSNNFSYVDSPGAECWDGYFPKPFSGALPTEWRFCMANGDTMGGTCTFVVSIKDLNANGIMEESEYLSKVCSATLIAWINFGAGTFEGFCGNGSFGGDLDLTDEVTMEEKLYVPYSYYGTGLTHLKDEGCSTPTGSMSWGAIKSLCK